MTSIDAHTIGVDIGGTSIRAAAVTADGVIIDSISTPTPAEATETDDALVRVIAELAGRHPVTAVGLAVAGFITADRRTVMFAPHLAWRDSPVPARLSARLELPVVMEHDVNAAVWAEYRLGAAIGSQVALLIALGTGIGAGLIVDGQIFRGANGVAPELGHLPVVSRGRRCSCGKSGCWERYCSGTALAQTAREMIGSLRSEHLLLLAGHDLQAVTGKMVGQAAKAGDPAALAALADLSDWLAYGLALAIDVFDPSVIVIGGGVSTISELFLPAAVASLPELVTGVGHRPLPEVVTAMFHDTASMIGAALLAQG